MTENKIDFFYCGDDRYSEVKKIRTEVFTNEQGADASGEFDLYDETALFALLYENGKAVAAARIAYIQNNVKIGRIAVLKSCRGRGYGAVIVKAVMQRAFDDGARRVFVDAQNYAVPFYEKLGFSVIADEITDRGLAHMPMCADKEEFYDNKKE